VQVYSSFTALAYGEHAHIEQFIFLEMRFIVEHERVAGISLKHIFEHDRAAICFTDKAVIPLSFQVMQHKGKIWIDGYPLRGCYFCGTAVQVKSRDPLLLEILPGGRSFNFCSHHLKKLLQHAPLPVIYTHRKKYLITTRSPIDRYSIARVIGEIEWIVLQGMTG
jgi:hypothetical protein